MEEVENMVVRNESQALCVAVEMERRAVRVYERALMLTEDPSVRDGIMEILGDEREHLKRFSQMKESYAMDAREEQLLISGLAAETLFPGGVMEMKRGQALRTLLDLYRYARDSEAHAVKTYSEFALRCGDQDVRDAFMSIVREESRHLAELRGKVSRLESALG